MKKIIYISVLIILLGSCSNETSTQTRLDKISLITWEFFPEEENNDDRIVKYTFSQDQLLIRKELAHSDNYFTGYFNNKLCIVNNRYIVGRSGDIFDLVKEKRLFKSIGIDSSVEKLDDRIIYKHLPYEPGNSYNVDSVRHSKIKSLYYYFDLEKEEIVEIDEGPKYQVEGVLSKNKEQGLEFIYDSNYDFEPKLNQQHVMAGKFYLNKFESEPILILDSIGTSINNIASWWSRPPVLWLDNERFLTHKNNGELILVDTNSKIQHFPMLSNLKNELTGPALYRNHKDQIIYNCPTSRSDEYVVDVENMSITEVGLVDHIGGNFSIDWKKTKLAQFEFAAEKKELINVRFNNKRILKHSSMTHQYAVYKDLIAIKTFENCEDYERYENRLKCSFSIEIYNNSGKLLETIECGSSDVLIGWIEN